MTFTEDLNLRRKVETTMEQIIIWGTGSVFNQNLFEIRRMVRDGSVNIVALIDQDKKDSVVDGNKVIDKQGIRNLNWDRILVAADKAYGSIMEDIKTMGIDERKVESLTHYLEKDYSLTTDKQIEIIGEILRASDDEVKSYVWMYQKIGEYGVFPFEQNVGNNHSDIFWSALGVCQTIEEFTEFCNYISGLTIRTAIEIGVFRGRSSYLMCALLARKNPDLRYVLVDIEDNLKEFDRFKEILPWMDKRIPSTSEDYIGQKFDFVFIDADHSYTASFQDYLNCGQYANKLTVFHDIYCHEWDEPDGGTVRMWEEVLEKTKEQGHRIFSSHARQWMGIGVIEWTDIKEGGIQEKIGKHWDEMSIKRNNDRRRWWQSPTVVRHINHKVCGKYLNGRDAGQIELLKEKAKDITINSALSIGCGFASTEMKLLEMGLVNHFSCYELSEIRINEGKRIAESKGLSEKITFHLGDFYESQENRNENFDMVFWNSSLHHMLDVEKAVRISYEVLKPGGIFFCNEYVGATRFQWSDLEIALANGIRTALPEEVLQNFEKYIKRPDLEKMKEIDFSEAADSENIIPSIRKFFQNLQFFNLGGTIYHLCLHDILKNIPENSDLLRWLLQMDDAAAEHGFWQYAFILARK